MALVPRYQPAAVPGYPSTEPRCLQPTVEEHLEDSLVLISSSVSSVGSSTLASRDEGADESEISSLSKDAPLMRCDFAHELARSLWGIVGPKGFGAVIPGVFRSSYPKPENLPFLRTLGLKTILTLVPEELPEYYRTFIAENDITHYQIGIEPNKDPSVVISSCKINAALGVILQKSNHPILIHCNKGKHRTGTVIGCLRKILAGGMEDEIITEYRHYAAHKARWLDERFIEKEFDERGLLWLARLNGYAPQMGHESRAAESPVATNMLSKTLTGVT